MQQATPTLIRWSAEEDESLTSLVGEHGKSWAVIASKLVGGTRSYKQCRSRWRHLDPSLSKDKWNAEEDESLTSLVGEHGKSSWVVVASKLVGGTRSVVQCSDRWQSLLKSSKLRKASSSSSSSSTTEKAASKHRAKVGGYAFDGKDDDSYFDEDGGGNFDIDLVDTPVLSSAALRPAISTATTTASRRRVLLRGG
jgi:hypothetical protein